MDVAAVLPPFDRILPDAPFSELHTRVVDAPIEAVWPECLAVTASDVRLLGPLMALRGVPAKLMGRRAPSTSASRPLIDVFADEGFVMLRRDPLL